MDTNALKKFAQAARTQLIDQVTSKLAVVLDPASAARREHPEAIKALDGAIADHGKAQVVEQVAYIWFNRFAALRFMDANGYTLPRVVSPTDGATRPEILAEAMAGNLPVRAPPAIAALLEGGVPSNDPQGEAYRLLLVHACNAWHQPMSFLFEKFDDYSELLMPEDLLSQTSILARLREVMTEDACRDVEIIGWLYQFYISEKKDQVFAGLKKNVKITAENIPAATQLFTPHWIVRYLVENSLGRLWLLNRPDSRLAERMDYYIAPEEPETEFLKITRPEEIRICDPAAGSGHMLTYAFDLLHAIYEEEGYDATEIPALILTHNLTGVEIDDRAGALAAFALMMKAAEKLGRRRFLRMEAKPDICVLQDVSFTPAEMQDVAAVVGKDLFTDELRETLGQFEQAKNFGSLIVPKLRDPAETLRMVEARDFGSDLLLKDVQARVVAVLRMAEALSPKYHVVVANPPYLSANGMNSKLKAHLDKCFSEFKADLYAAFMERSFRLSRKNGYSALITMHSWMFLMQSYAKMRVTLFENQSFHQLLHLGSRAFPTIGGEVVQVAAYVASKQKNRLAIPSCFRLIDGDSEAKQQAVKNGPTAFHRLSQQDFLKLPGSPFAYWASANTVAAFDRLPTVSDIANPRIGLQTGDNETFLRLWHEVGFGKFCRPSEFNFHSKEAEWFPHNKGGEYRKWYGNCEVVVSWGNDGKAIKEDKARRLAAGTIEKKNSECWNSEYYFREGATWTRMASGNLALRIQEAGMVFDTASPTIFTDSQVSFQLLGLLNSKVAKNFAALLNPTLSFQSGDLKRIPVTLPFSQNERPITTTAMVETAKSDWDAYETSWDFAELPLLSPDHRGETLAESYATLRAHWQSMTDEMQRLEEENNRIFIDAYGLQDELTPEVPLEEITLTCNPAYRYGVKTSEADRETRLRADTMAEFLSYAVGCMFGRYSLDTPGLILANQGERLEDYLAQLAEKGWPDPRFMPDEDNVIPVLDGDWFADDITERFRLFLRVTFGEVHFRENLRYVEEALGKDIRKYFTKDFYADHVKRYKKRPIYWMFSSPKGTFNALIYMHRYRADTVSVLLNDYLREFISKLIAERKRLETLSDDPTATQGQQTKALKDAGVVAKQIDELNEWEREVIFPLAQQKIEIDLDDGVKANYPKFGTALRKIPGLEAPDE